MHVCVHVYVHVCVGLLRRSMRFDSTHPCRVACICARLLFVRYDTCVASHICVLFARVVCEMHHSLTHICIVCSSAINLVVSLDW